MQFRDVLLAVLISAVWGFNFLASKWAVADLPPLTANLFRFLIVLAVLVPFLKVVQGKMRQMLAVAFLLGVLHFGLLFSAMSLADGVSSISVASQLNVPFATLLAVLVLKETVGWYRILGISLSFVGVLILGFDPEVFAYWDAILLIVLGAFVFALASVMMRQLKEVPAVTVQAWVAFAAVSGSILLSGFFESGQIEAVKNTGMRAWLAVVYTAVGSSLIGHGGANYLFRKYEISTVTPYFLVMPLFSIISGVVFLGEVIHWELIVGGLFTISGVLIVTIRNNIRLKPSKAPRSYVP
ncbi:DMT family transporter [Kordiimonas aquimaris]|uniref:DMT family transporter n=1 Tax=Kordiimonas aquimaris TaxID=707591 RepID=UPI0021D19216|nr:DMT family transporter [Kordiimonas aquimaris]